MAERSITIKLCGNRALEITRQMMSGSIDYARTHTAWRLVDGDSPADALIDFTSSPLPGAAITIASSGKRVHVSPDVEAVARLAVDHLADRGIRSFAGAGLDENISAAVVGRLRAAGTFMPLAPGGARFSAADLAALPRATGVLCSDDAVAAALASAAFANGQGARDDLFILGMGDDALVCELAAVPLSSIDLNARHIGYTAARLLERLLHRKPVPESTSVAPAGVTLRATTDRLAIDDADLAAAVRFLRANAHRPVEITDVLLGVPLHRRALERRFRNTLGRSPAEELRRARVDIAKGLLTRTDLPLRDIARRAGFIQPQHLAAAFKLVTSMTPSAYRAQFKRN